MIEGLKRHNKKKAFTLVELMLLLVVLSLVIASSYSLITRKHRLVPRKSVHGQYACFMEPVVNEDTNEVTYDIRELEISGDTVLRDSADDPEPPEQCQFNFPRNASYVYMQVIGGGGAGGNANYKIADNTYKHNTYLRSINLIEDDWARREQYTPGTIYRKYKPKDSSSGENRISAITSWGGTTIVNNAGSYNVDYPRVNVTVSGTRAAAELPGTDSYTPSDSYRKQNPKRGISRSYVDNHFAFNAHEKQVDTELSMARKGNYAEVSINEDSSNRISLFDSNLFQYIVRNNVVDKMFAYDYGGGGPTAPGYYISPLYAISETNPKDAFNCIPMGNDGPKKNLSECLVRSYNDGLLGVRSDKTAARNVWCALPIRPFANASTNGASVCKSNGSCNADYKLTVAEENYINNYNNMDAIMSSCPIMYQYYRRRTAPPAQCYGGTGGGGSLFTSVPVEYSYNFFPVLGIRWNRNQFLPTPNFNTLNCDPESEQGQDNFMCYYSYPAYRCNIPSDTVPSSDPAVADVIDFTCYKTVADAQASAQYKVRYTGTNNEITLQQGALNLNDLTESYAGQLKSCSVTPPNTTDCVKINNVWYDKALGIGGTPVNAPAFISEENKPKLEYFIDFEILGQPIMRNWNYRTGGYPHGYKTDEPQKGYGVGVGFVIERDFSFMNPHSSNNPYDRSVLSKPIATACIAPGLLAFSNAHQFGNGQTVENQSYENLVQRYPLFDGTYIPIPYQAGGSYTVYDVNAPNPLAAPISNISTAETLYPNYLGIVTNNHYYKWLKHLTKNESYGEFGLGDLSYWLGCTGDKCLGRATGNVKYLNEAFGMSKCDQSGGPSCYGKEVSGKHYNVEDCMNVPLENPTIPDDDELYVTDSDGNQVVNSNGPLSAQIPKSFGTAGTKQLTSDNLQDVVANGVVVHPYYVFNPDGSLYQCPGKQGIGADGNTGLDPAKTNKLVFVGRTGLLLKESGLKSSVLSAPSETASANNMVTLNGEDKVGLQIKLHYYTHALSHGTPGEPGEYKTIFARAFTNSNVIVVPGVGGARVDIKPGDANKLANNGSQTELRYNCDSNNENCSTIVAHGGRGGVSGKLDDETEYAQLHQTPAYIKKAIAKLDSIKSNGYKYAIPAPDSDGTVDTMSSPDTFNIFPHCSKAAPRYQKDQYDTEHGNVAKYMINGKTVIDATCYGSGIVEADDSYFAADAGLFDLSHITNDIDITTVGKGGDGGFVRDDCWVVPQYFEIKGLFDTAIPSDGGLIYDASYNGLNNRNPNNSAFSEARTLNWGVLQNFEEDTIYNYFNGDKYGNSANAEKMRLSGYTGIYPNKIYSRNPSGANSCRNQHNRYYSGEYLDSADGQSGYAVNGYTRVGYRAYGQTDATLNTPGWKAQYATEIQATEGQPGGVFITW